jgi:crotonobetainyl-CoA:carnitine CoA-transferase CaiB-like acyl-CoA transferase
VGAPRLGEHTREVLSALLDLSDADLDRLASEGIT